MYYLLTSKQKVAIKAVYKLHEGFRLCDSNWDWIFELPVKKWNTICELPVKNWDKICELRVKTAKESKNH